MLSVAFSYSSAERNYDECRHTKCYYTECRYAECLGGFPLSISKLCSS
jgi:hypothetical protein